MSPSKQPRSSTAREPLPDDFIQLLRQVRPHLREERAGHVRSVNCELKLALLGGDLQFGEAELGYIRLARLPRVQSVIAIVERLGLIPLVVRLGPRAVLCSMHPTEPLYSIHATEAEARP